MILFDHLVVAMTLYLFQILCGVAFNILPVLSLPLVQSSVARPLVVDPLGDFLKLEAADEVVVELCLSICQHGVFDALEVLLSNVFKLRNVLGANFEVQI